MYLTPTPTQTLRRTTATCRITPTACIQSADAGSALRSAWPGAAANGWACSIRDRMAGRRLSQSWPPRKKAAKQSSPIPLAQFKAPEAVGAIWSLSDAWVKLISKEIEATANQPKERIKP